MNNRWCCLQTKKHHPFHANHPTNTVVLTWRTMVNSASMISAELNRLRASPQWQSEKSRERTLTLSASSKTSSLPAASRPNEVGAMADLVVEMTDAEDAVVVGAAPNPPPDQEEAVPNPPPVANGSWWILVDRRGAARLLRRLRRRLGFPPRFEREPAVEAGNKADPARDAASPAVVSAPPKRGSIEPPGAGAYKEREERGEKWWVAGER